MSNTDKIKKPKPQSYQSTVAQIKEIEDDPTVKSMMMKLPPNYDFEIGKTVWRIRSMKGRCRTVALQFPEGLLIHSTRIAAILTSLTNVDIIIMGDITYGACCIDDYTASLLSADLLVHYGHSCLVPTSTANRVETIYIFVTIRFNIQVASISIAGVINSIRGQKDDKGPVKIEYENRKFHVAIVSTIQFANSLGELKADLEGRVGGDVSFEVPRSLPLSRGEVLGCTAPKVNVDLIVYVGDGRFHLEAMMMANPFVGAVRHDPYNTTTTIETFNHTTLSISRSAQITKLLQSSKSNPSIGLILGTLGRQGNPKPVHHIFDKMKDTHLKPFVICMSEVMPAKLEMFGERVAGWVQFACPRLSIDWGGSFSTPVLSSFEGKVLVSKVNDMVGDRDCCTIHYEHHPMDYYAYDSGGGHTPNYRGGGVSKKSS